MKIFKRKTKTANARKMGALGRLNTAVDPPVR